MENQSLMVPTGNWLDTVGGSLSGGAPSGYGVGGGGVTNVTTNCYPVPTWGWNSWYPYYQPVFVSSPARPIKLTLSEVERLRKAAHTDPKLKAILGKFTEQIEIAVDFD